MLNTIYQSCNLNSILCKCIGSANLKPAQLGVTIHFHSKRDFSDCNALVSKINLWCFTSDSNLSACWSLSTLKHSDV